MSTDRPLDWSPLEVELAQWHRTGLTLPLWWRDDDAIEPTAQMNQLSALSQNLALPVHLAVIPAHVKPELADYLTDNPTLLPLVHGWAHKNHAGRDQKKCEFPTQRPAQASIGDIEQGLRDLRALFGAKLLPIFVPPWNRIAPELLPSLPSLGFTALSTFTPRQSPLAAPGLAQINTHLDPIDWKRSRSLVAPERLIAQVCDQLRARREGKADNHEPYGILTHHLVHDAAIWQFTEALIKRLMQGPGRVCQLDNKENST
ncbi:MAG: polysaccharide deacetylase [Roseobacter sp. MedPE-SW]|nr:MAG: polysaccharide deacetylase [Roseobacter sp. MedPE-SW]